MEQELEIEYKNSLKENEYQNIFSQEFLSDKESELFPKIEQENYYFDTKEKHLKKQGSALRIRRLISHNELTFKVPQDGFLMETNLMLTTEQVESILTKGYLQLKELTQQDLPLTLEEINLETIFYPFNYFKTIRYEKKTGDHLLVLDQTFFQNNKMDYELEVEGKNPVDTKKYFDRILNKYTVPQRSSLPKIARAERNKS